MIRLLFPRNRKCFHRLLRRERRAVCFTRHTRSNAINARVQVSSLRFCHLASPPGDAIKASSRSTSTATSLENVDSSHGDADSTLSNHNSSQEEAIDMVHRSNDNENITSKHSGESTSDEILDQDKLTRKEIEAIFQLATNKNKNSPDVDASALSKYISEKCLELNVRNYAYLLHLIRRSRCPIQQSDLAVITKYLEVVYVEQNYGQLFLSKQFTHIELGSMFAFLKSINSKSLQGQRFIVALKDVLRNVNSILDRDTIHMPANVMASLCIGLHNLSSSQVETFELLDELRMFIDLHSKPTNMSAPTIAATLYGLRGLNTNHDEVLSLLKSISLHIGFKGCKMEGWHIANALMGLRAMSCHHEVVRDMLRELDAQMNIAIRSKKSPFMKPRDVATCLHSLMNKSSSSDEVRLILSRMKTFVEQLPKNSLDGMTTSICLYGLRYMSGLHREVQELVSAISDKVDLLTGFSNSLQISNTLYGLQNNGNHYSAVNIVENIVKKLSITSRSIQLDEIELSAAVYGLQRFQSCHEEVKSLLIHLTRMANANEKEMRFNSTSVKTLFYGLQSMSNEQEEVRGLIAAVLSRLKATELEKISSYRYGDVAASLFYGIKEMDSSHAEVRELIQWIVDLGKDENADSFTAQELCMSLFGLQNMNYDHEEVMEAVRMLTGYINKRLENSESDASFVISSQGKGMCVNALQRMTLKGDMPRRGELNSVLSTVLAVLERFSSCPPSSSDGLTYRDQYMRSEGKNDEHILGGLMLSLYGVAGLLFNEASSRRIMPAKQTQSLSVRDVLAYLEDGIVSAAHPPLIPRDDSPESSLSSGADRQTILHMLRQIRSSFAAEEEMAFSSSLEGISPSIRSKSMLNLRRNASIVADLLSGEEDAAVEGLREWLEELQQKASELLRKEQRLPEVSELCSEEGDIPLSHPLSLRGTMTHNPLLAARDGVKERPQPRSASRLSDVTASVGRFLVTEFDWKYRPAEAFVLDILLKRLITGDGAHPSVPEDLEVFVNGLGNVTFISNPSVLQFDVCLTLNEVLHGVDTDIVMRLYSRENTSSRHSVLPMSFSRPPLATFDIEVDGPFHNYPRKQFFGQLRDHFLSNKTSMVHCLTPGLDKDGDRDGEERGITVIRLGLDSVAPFSTDEMINSLLQRSS